jgi:hypothetical protein
MQIFQADHLVFAHQPGGNLVLHVTAGIRDLCMYSGNPPVLRDGHTAWLCSIGQRARPHDREWLLVLGRGELAIPEREGIVRIGGR